MTFIKWSSFRSSMIHNVWIYIRTHRCSMKYIDIFACSKTMCFDRFYNIQYSRYKTQKHLSLFFALHQKLFLFLNTIFSYRKKNLHENIKNSESKKFWPFQKWRQTLIMQLRQEKYNFVHKTCIPNICLMLNVAFCKSKILPAFLWMQKYCLLFHGCFENIFVFSYFHWW